MEEIGGYIKKQGITARYLKAIKKYRLLYSLNPMAGVIDGFRWCLLGDAINIQSFALSVTITFIFVFIGIYYFRKMEKSFADNI